MKQTKRATFKLLFYLKKNAPKKDGTIPIMARITINGKIAQFSTKLSVDLKKWNLKFGKVSGRSNEVKSINQKLDTIRVRINQCYSEILHKDQFVSVQKVKNKFLGIGNESDFVIPFFKKHNQSLEKEEGINLAKATLYRYSITYKHLKNFLTSEYHNIDIRFQEINQSFIQEFKLFLQIKMKLSHNTIWNYMGVFSKIINVAIKKEIITRSPFNDYKVSYNNPDRNFLIKQEIEQFNAVIPQNKCEELVKDLFIFSCFTGLAYIDVKNLKKSELQTFLDGSLWIIKRRQKTSSQSNIRMLDIPKKITEKYQDFSDEFVFPMPSYPTIRKYLKSLQYKSKINKHITFHIARHTFATLFLSENVPLESVSKMMGHSNLSTTLIYAKITNKKISHDLDRLEQQIKPFEQQMLSTI